MRRAIGLVGLAFALASCGSSSGGLSKAALTAQANAICKRALAAVTSIPQPSPGAANTAGLTTYLDRVAPIAEQQLAQLLALRPASDLASAWNDFIAKERTATQTLAQAQAQGGNLGAIQRLIQAATTEGAAANAAALKVGATTCASG
jgi:hypothetical protein